jgi:hypothetical protein
MIWCPFCFFYYNVGVCNANLWLFLPRLLLGLHACNSICYCCIALWNDGWCPSASQYPYVLTGLVSRWHKHHTQLWSVEHFPYSSKHKQQNRCSSVHLRRACEPSTSYSDKPLHLNLHLMIVPSCCTCHLDKLPFEAIYFCSNKRFPTMLTNIIMI